MNIVAKKSFLLACFLAIVLAPFASAKAQDSLKPALVISLASIDEQFADAGYLLEAAGFPELGLFLLGKDEWTKGLDAQKPIGGYVLVSDMKPQIVGFFGVNDLQTFLDRLAEQLGEPQEAGDGVKKVTGPNGKDVYFKEQGSWVFASDGAANLASLPKDPPSLLSSLDRDYNIAARVYVQNIPKHLRDQAVTWMKDAFEQSLQEELENDNPDARQMSEKLGRSFLNSMVQFVEETDQLTFGWGVDSNAGSTFFDFASTAVEGTKLAEQMAVLKEAKSEFTGFLLPDAAATLHFSGRVPQADIDNLVAMSEMLRNQAMKELDKDNDLDDDERIVAKELLGELLDVCKQTVESGKLDGGAAVVLAPSAATFAAGGRVADGAVVEKLLKKVAELAEDEPEFPEITFNAAQHGDVRFHTMRMPVPEDEEDARKLLGDKLDVAVGIGATSAYLAVGKDAIATLKKVIDQSAADRDKVVPPSQFKIALTPFVKFAASVSDDERIAMLVEAMDRSMGKDKLTIVSRSVERGYLTRLELEEGVLQAIGIGVKAALQRFGAARGGRP